MSKVPVWSARTGTFLGVVSMPANSYPHYVMAIPKVMSLEIDQFADTSRPVERICANILVGRAYAPSGHYIALGQTYDEDIFKQMVKT